ncbi:unnamed protein product, partial [Ectocarpus sp. 12 AP-2014]
GNTGVLLPLSKVVLFSKSFAPYFTPILLPIADASCPNNVTLQWYHSLERVVPRCSFVCPFYFPEYRLPTWISQLQRQQISKRTRALRVAQVVSALFGTLFSLV